MLREFPREGWVRGLHAHVHKNVKAQAHAADTDARRHGRIRARTFPHPNSLTHSISLPVRACMRRHVDFSIGACISINTVCSHSKPFSLSPTLSRTHTLSYFDGFGIEYFASIQPRHFLRYYLFFCFDECLQRPATHQLHHPHKDTQT